MAGDDEDLELLLSMQDDENAVVNATPPSSPARHDPNSGEFRNDVDSHFRTLRAHRDRISAWLRRNWSPRSSKLAHWAVVFEFRVSMLELFQVAAVSAVGCKSVFEEFHPSLSPVCRNELIVDWRECLVYYLVSSTRSNKIKEDR